MILRGACHCGQVEVAFETAMSVADLPLRACGCSFCRRHGTKAVADPNGRLTISAPPNGLNRYRFGLAHRRLSDLPDLRGLCRGCHLGKWRGAGNAECDRDRNPRACGPARRNRSITIAKASRVGGRAGSQVGPRAGSSSERKRGSARPADDRCPPTSSCRRCRLRWRRAILRAG